MPVKHLFNSTKTDGPDVTLVKASNWNASHVDLIGITAVSANYSVLDADEILECTAGSGGITLTLPSASGRTGKKFEFLRVDAAAGVVTIATTSSQTINGITTYLLTNQWQFVLVYCDGTNWKIRGQN